MRNDYAEMLVRDLVPAAYNPNLLPEAQFAQLVDEVRRQGRVLKPVVVRLDGDGRHHIVDGEHNWRAAEAAGLTVVAVEVIEVGEFEARRQTFKRNLVGTTHKVRLGRMYAEMLAMGNPQLDLSGLDGGMSNRELAGELGASEGTVRNMLLYAKAADLCAGRDDAPDEDAIAQMGVRELRALIAQLENGESECEEPKSAAAEAPDLRALKKAWDKASAPSRAAFVQWAGLSPPPKSEPAPLYDEEDAEASYKLARAEAAARPQEQPTEPTDTRNDHAKAGRKPGPPKVIIPEIEALLAQGYSLRAISTGMGGGSSLASLLRLGLRPVTDDMRQRLQAYAAAAGVAP